MKNMIFLLSLTALLFSACDDNTSDSDPTLDGSWDLVSYVFFGPEVPMLNEGDVKWTFDVANSTVSVESNVEATYPYMEDSGTYNYIISDNIIEIDGLGDYEYSVTPNELRMDTNTDPAISADGPVLRFEKD